MQRESHMQYQQLLVLGLEHRVLHFGAWVQATYQRRFEATHSKLY